MSQENQQKEREFVVHWEARVYGTYGTYAESEEEAIREAEQNAIPEREAEDRAGGIEVVHVEDYS